MSIRTFAALPALALLVACGAVGEVTGPQTGSDNDPEPPPGPTVGRTSVTVDVNPLSTIRFANHIPDIDKIRLGLRGNPFAPDPNPIFTLDRNSNVVRTLPDGFAIYTSTGNRQKAVRAVTPSGDGLALSVLLLSGAESSREHQRLRSTELPTGSATYAGDYLGTLIRLGTDPAAGTYAPQNDEYILGKVALTADFATARISGTVSGRRSNAGRSFGDTQLRSTSIDDAGRFGGSVSGGAASNSPIAATTRDSGTDPDLGYHGVITGADGTEAVGNVGFDHVTRAGVDLAREVGVFVATAP
jgi:hypothetical protein